ncbi:Beta-hexosaminidase [Candida viswanathii]|uniref:Beta-hexosaminidase n=1 Tax=Candida viswanathii TaxID=5486 RepID=A0A367YGT7_9ASCO|nr:Beta-hexosaminidase [Candida viswanathii]
MLVWYFLFLLSVVSCATVPDPLPAAQNITWFNDTAIEINTSILYTNNTLPLIQQAFTRAVSTIEKLEWAPYPHEEKDYPQGCMIQSPLVNIEIDDVDADLQLGVDESYTLTISPTAITIHAATIWGALHSLTTLQQLIVYSRDGRFLIPLSVEIIDEPNFPHRGIMIDSARNFLSVKSILEHIDIMALSKMNSLHWHLVDSQSWPIALESYPEMTQDAYSPEEVYSTADIKYIVEYARARAIRVIPEIDMPGHARAGWRKVDPTIVECANAFWTDAAVEPPPGQLNILSEKTYEVITNVYNELSDVFTDHMFHVGNDELQEKCYSKLVLKNTTMEMLLAHYLDKALPIYFQVPERRLTMWDDVLLSDVSVPELPANVTLQIWHEPAGIKNLTSRGYDVIVSLYEYLYLDCGYAGFVTNDPRYVDSPDNIEFNTGQAGSWCGPYKSYQRIYDFDILANLTESEQQHVLGAEAALWSEQVDSSVLISKIWPRAAALGESLWSGNRTPLGNHRNYEFTQRILNFREYLVKLGYGPSALVPKYCIMNPHACDLFKMPPDF